MSHTLTIRLRRPGVAPYTVVPSPASPGEARIMAEDEWHRVWLERERPLARAGLRYWQRRVRAAEGPAE